MLPINGKRKRLFCVNGDLPLGPSFRSMLKTPPIPRLLLNPLRSSVGFALLLIGSQVAASEPPASCSFWFAAIEGTSIGFTNFSTETMRDVTIYPPYRCQVWANSERRSLVCSLPRAKQPVLAAQRLASEIAACFPDAKFYRPQMPDDAHPEDGGSQSIRIPGRADIYVNFGGTTFSDSNMHVWVGKI